MDYATKMRLQAARIDLLDALIKIIAFHRLSRTEVALLLTEEAAHKLRGGTRPKRRKHCPTCETAHS